MKKLNRFDFIPTVLASELSKSRSIEKIIDKLSGFLSMEKLIDLYKNSKDFLEENKFTNFELRFYSCYKFIEKFLDKKDDKTFPQEVMGEYKFEMATYYIVSAIIRRFKGTNDIVVMSVADPFIDAIEKLPKVYMDMASTLTNNFSFNDLKKLDEIFTAVKIEQKEYLRECGRMAIQTIDGMIFDNNGDKNQLTKQDLQSSFTAFIDNLDGKFLGTNTRN